jgi:predicted phosphohydrolase
MKIDYISDIHLDIWHPFQPITNEIVKEILGFHLIPEKRELLLIAGDLGHSNLQNQEFLLFLKEHLYEHIIFVLGNHDYYLLQDFDGKRFNNSFERVNEMRSWADTQVNIHCLDGSIVDIEGVRFGGAMSWYDGSFDTSKEYRKLLQKLWQEKMNDSVYIKGCGEYFDDLFKIEIEKIKQIYKKCDVMITHVNPSPIFGRTINKDKYKNQLMYNFYCFDGNEFVENGSMKHWVYGHDHEIKSFDSKGVQFYCNAIGYREQIWNRGIRSFEVQAIS